MICKQCNAEFDENLAACPYCGEINYIGAEQEYLNHIQDINEDLSDMADDSKEEYQSSFKKIFTIFIAIFCTLLLIAGLILGIFLLRYKHLQKQSEDRQKAMLLWKNNYYSKLDELYDAGQYEEIALFLNEHSDDEGYNPYMWEHMDFIFTYQKYLDFLDDSASYTGDNLATIHWTIYDILYLEEVTNQSYSVYSEKELEQISEWQAEAHAFLTEELQMTESDIEELKQAISGDGTTLPNYDKCKKYVQENFK